jgi:hypothetical protein
MTATSWTPTSVQLFARLIRGSLRRGKSSSSRTQSRPPPVPRRRVAPYTTSQERCPGPVRHGQGRAVCPRVWAPYVVSGVSIRVVTVHDVSAEGDVRSNHLKCLPFPPPDPDCSRQRWEHATVCWPAVVLALGRMWSSAGALRLVSSATTPLSWATLMPAAGRQPCGGLWSVMR